MIAYLKGSVVEKSPTHLILDVHDTGYFINISLNTYTQLGDQKTALLYIQQIIREDAHSLFGFYTDAERSMFQLLTTVSGVGANTARLILSSLTTDEIKAAIASENAVLLQSVKGIGGKTAQRIVVDLKDRVGKTVLLTEKAISQHNSKKEEALSGLIVLGFHKSAAEKALIKIMKEQDTLSVEELIKNALKIL